MNNNLRQIFNKIFTKVRIKSDYKISSIKKLIEEKGFFNEEFYLEKYQDASLANGTAIDHFLKVGLWENRLPNQNFDPNWYLEYYQDVKESKAIPVIHFLKHGLKEGRFENSQQQILYEQLLNSEKFNKEFYKANYEDLSGKNDEFDFIHHYVRYGQYEGRIYKPDIDQVVLNSELKFDIREFDRDYYFNNNPDVVSAGLDLEAHFYAFGEQEGRKPNAEFDPNYYYRLNADVRVANISAFKHFREHGYKEGRPYKLLRNYALPDKEMPLLFVGHDANQAGSQVVLLEVLKWFSENTTRSIKLLLLNTGPLTYKYASYADVYTLASCKIDKLETFKSFLNEKFEFIYLNTVVTGGLFDLLDTHQISLQGNVVTHIHEMEKVIAEHEAEMQNHLSNTKLWISASPSSSETLTAKYQIPKDKVITIPAFINPIVGINTECDELKKQAREALGLSEKAIVIGCCGTVYWRKGPDIFIETAREILQKTDQFIEFFWIGDGPDKEPLEAQLSQEERSHIKFVGSRTDANFLLVAADIFYLSSREDPFPLVVLESAQYAIPSVCFKPATGITQFVGEDAGMIVSDINVSYAASAILELINYPDKRKKLGYAAKQKLFAHYTAEQQNIKIYEVIKEHTSYKPSISVIVPCYNHERFITERLNSIVNQTIKDIEIIILDDFSTDGSVKKIKPYLSDSRITLFENKRNSGSPFKQWEKGIKLANSEIVWIAEGDDTCDANFLQTLLPYFNDEMLNIAYAKTEVIDENGVIQGDALRSYLNMAYSRKFDSSYIKDGFVEVNEQLGAICTLVNASGMLIRKSTVGKTLKVAQKFKMCGDWLIYLECLKEGKVAYDVTTHNYFRRHRASQVHKIEGTKTYFKERFAVTEYVVNNFTVKRRVLRKAFDAIDYEWSRFQHMHPTNIKLHQLYNKNAILKKVKYIEGNERHIGFYVHGMTFSKGGIERMAAKLSNHLVEKGWRVTIFCRVHEQINSVYPLYESVNVAPIFDENKLEESIEKLNTALSNSDIDVFVPMLSEWLFDPIIEAARNTGIPIIASEHNDPWKIEELWWNHEKRVKCFEKVDVIHLLLNKFNESLPNHLAKRVVYIPNGVHLPLNLNLRDREKLIVSAGRLEVQKRFDRLIEAVSIIQNELREYSYRVEIYGEGSLKDELRKQINKEHVDDLILLKGNTSDLEQVFSTADFFVIPSEFEGFGLVLVEALACGLPALAFSECNGPNEIIRDGVEGLLVEDVLGLSKAILSYAKADQTRRRKAAKERAENYSIEKFYQLWIDALLDTSSSTQLN